MRHALGGKWEELPNLPEVTFMHALLLANSSRILFWGYGPRADQARIWDQATGLYAQPANQPQMLTADENIWSGAHAYLDDASREPFYCLEDFIPPKRLRLQATRSARILVRSNQQQLLACNRPAHKPLLPNESNVGRCVGYLRFSVRTPRPA